MPEQPEGARSEESRAAESASEGAGSEGSRTGQAQSEQSQEADGRAAPPPTPFDHPFFLPAILAGLTLWFGYDAYLNQDPEMLEHLAFNRYGFRVLLGATIWSGHRGWAELRDRPAHSLVLPGVLLGLAAWFGYAGWLSDDPFEVEHALWNQYGCYAFLALAALFGARGLWHLRRRVERDASSPWGKVG